MQPGLKDRPDPGQLAQHGSWREKLAYSPACMEERRGGKKTQHLQSS